MLKHIAISITKSDLKDFYINILGGEISGQFTLKHEDAIKIFDINNQVEVYYLTVGSIEFELFINPMPSITSFNHTCIAMKNASEIYLQAFNKNYWTHLRQNNKWETYFIKDKSGNMFELKNNI